MDRRSFIKLLGGTAITVVTPKLIFDMGANLYRLDRCNWEDAFTFTKGGLVYKINREYIILPAKELYARIEIDRMVIQASHSNTFARMTMPALDKAKRRYNQ